MAYARQLAPSLEFVAAVGSLLEARAYVTIGIPSRSSSAPRPRTSMRSSSAPSAWPSRCSSGVLKAEEGAGLVPWVADKEGVGAPDPMVEPGPQS